MRSSTASDLMYHKQSIQDYTRDTPCESVVWRQSWLMLFDLQQQVNKNYFYREEGIFIPITLLDHYCNSMRLSYKWVNGCSKWWGNQRRAGSRGPWAPESCVLSRLSSFSPEIHMYISNNVKATSFGWPRVSSNLCITSWSHSFLLSKPAPQPLFQ